VEERGNTGGRKKEEVEERPGRYKGRVAYTCIRRKGMINW